MKTDPRPMLYEKIRKYLEQTIKLVCDVYRKKDNIYYEFHIFEDLENVVMFMDGNRKIIEEVARRVCKNFKHDFGMDINIQGTHFKLDRSYDSQVRMGVYLAKDFHSFDMNYSVAYWGMYNGEYVFLNIYPYYEYADDYLNPDFDVKGETRIHKHIENIGEEMKNQFISGELNWIDYTKWFQEYYGKELYDIEHIERRLNI